MLVSKIGKIYSYDSQESPYRSELFCFLAGIITIGHKKIEISIKDMKSIFVTYNKQVVKNSTDISINLLLLRM
jgi:hypothetical protein